MQCYAMKRVGQAIFADYVMSYLNIFGVGKLC